MRGFTASVNPIEAGRKESLSRITIGSCAHTEAAHTHTNTCRAGKGRSGGSRSFSVIQWAWGQPGLHGKKSVAKSDLSLAELSLDTYVQALLGTPMEVQASKRRGQRDSSVIKNQDTWCRGRVLISEPMSRGSHLPIVPVPGCSDASGLQWPCTQEHTLNLK